MKNPHYDQIRTLRGKNIVIAASAGCGKTTAMISRIADLIVKDHVPIKEFLVLTFTKASAADMTAKLARELRKASPSSSFARSQLEELDTADICTLDKFCQKILRNYFYLCDLDPSFEVLENDEIDFLEEKIFDRVYREQLENDPPGFFALTDILRSGRTNTPLFLTVKKLKTFCELAEDPEAYLRQGLFAGLESDPEKNPAFRAAGEHIRTACKDWAGRLSLLSAQMAAAELFKDQNTLDRCVAQLESVCTAPLPELFSRLHALDFPSFQRLSPPQLEDPVFASLHKTGTELKTECKKYLDKLKAAYPDRSLEEIQAELAGDRVLLSALSEFTLIFWQAVSLEKKRQSRLTFSDIEHLCLKVLRTGAGQEIRDSYRYVFVDECQDINAVQDAIIRSVAKSDNLFCVGDLKQSIYRFRGAEPDLFADRCESAGRHPENQLFRLGTNYRTDIRILNAVDAVFSALMTPGFSRIDYRHEDQLNGVHDSGLSDDQPVEIWALPESASGPDLSTESTPDREEEDAARKEGRAVAQIIRSLTEGSIRFTDPDFLAVRVEQRLPPSVCHDDIAVLVRGRNKIVRTVMEVLREESIPVSAEFEATPTDYPEILLLLDFLKILDNTRQDIPLVAVMRSFLGNFSDRELGRIRADAPKDARYFWQCLEACAASAADTPLSEKCRDFLSLLLRFRQAAATLEVGPLLAQICRELSVESWLAARPGGQETWAVLQSFLLSLEGKKQTETLGDYLAYLSRFDLPPLPVSLPSGGRGAVHLTTIHKSKGLEYPIVILCGLSSAFRLNDRDIILFDRELGGCMKRYDPVTRQAFPSFLMSAARYRQRLSALREELNLLYVAMTRPKYKLILTSVYDPQKLREITSDADIKEINRAFPVLFPLLKPLSQVTVHNSVPSRPRFDLPPVNLNSRPNRLTEDLKAGIGVTYVCPESLGLPRKSTVTEQSRAEVSFLAGVTGEVAAALETAWPVSSADRLPAVTPESGTAYHLALELLDFDQTDPESVEDQLRIFVAEGKLTPQQQALLDPHLLSSCLHTLTPLLRNRRVLREQPFLMEVDQPGGTLLIQGKIDLLIVEPDGVTVIDYKFSGHSDRELRERYAAQLNYYAEAVQRAGYRVKAKYLFAFARNSLIPL